MLDPLPPQGQYTTIESSRSRITQNSQRRVGSVRNCTDRSYTVSLLIEDERNAPYAGIPSHDEYNQRDLRRMSGISCGTQQISVDLA